MNEHDILKHCQMKKIQSAMLLCQRAKDFVVVNVGLDVQYLVLEPGRSSFGFEASHVLAITFVSPEREWRQVR